MEVVYDVPTRGDPATICGHLGMFSFPWIFADLCGVFGFIMGSWLFAVNAMVFGSVAFVSSCEPF